MASYKAVFFDLDGTLVDSVPQLTEGVNAVMAYKNLQPFTNEEVSRMVGRGVRVLMQRVCDARTIVPNEEVLLDMERRYTDFVKSFDRGGLRFYPGALEGVRMLRELGLKVVLCTNKSRAMTEDFLELYRIDGLFDYVVTADDVRYPKPAPDMLFYAGHLTGTRPRGAVMIGDSSNDAIAARRAGIRVILVRTGYNEDGPIDRWARLHSFRHVADGAAEACRMVQRWVGEQRTKEGV